MESITNIGLGFTMQELNDPGSGGSQRGRRGGRGRGRPHGHGGRSTAGSGMDDSAMHLNSQGANQGGRGGRGESRGGTGRGGAGRGAPGRGGTSRGGLERGGGGRRGAGRGRGERSLEQWEQELREQLRQVEQQRESNTPRGESSGSNSARKGESGSSSNAVSASNKDDPLVRLQRENEALKREQAMAEERRALAEGREKSLRRILEQSKEADFCYLVDITQSQQEVVNMLHDYIQEVIAGLRLNYSYLKVRVAFVGYRDYDVDEVVVIPFTEDLESFKQQLAKVEAKGGADEPEDVLSGLEAVGKLEWSSSPTTCRQILHIADAPCHGREFHGLADDKPDGDFKTPPRDLKALFKVLQEEKQVQGYHFSHVFRETTQQMINRFKEVCQDGNTWITEDDNFADPSLMSAAVSAKMTNSIAVHVHRATASVGVQGAAIEQPRPRRFDLNLKVPNWSNLVPGKARVIKFSAPENIESILANLDPKKPAHKRFLKEKMYDDLPFQIAPEPFAQGGSRLAYHGRLVGDPNQPIRNVVFKEFTNRGLGENTEQKYRTQASVQALASKLAKLFNEDIRTRGIQGVPELKFVDALLVSYKNPGDGKPRHFTAESPLLGNWIKWLDNTHKKKSFGDGTLETLEAFALWTYLKSGRKFIVVDLQGVKSHNGSLILTDPAIHSPDMSLFGDTNMGIKGINDFLASHFHNSVCEQLGLERIGRGSVPFDPRNEPVLLKEGQKFVPPIGLQRVTVEDRWRFLGEKGAQYLDASALVFDDSGLYLGHVDYKTDLNVILGPDTITHSGDKFNKSKDTGYHEIQINLKNLPPCVMHIFLTISGWKGKTLDMLRQPFIRIRNPEKNNQLLCQFNFGSKYPKEQLAQYRSAIMCRITRGQEGFWSVLGLGKLGQGAAGEYEPLIEGCKQFLS